MEYFRNDFIRNTIYNFMRAYCFGNLFYLGSATVFGSVSSFGANFSHWITFGLRITFSLWITFGRRISCGLKLTFLLWTTSRKWISFGHVFQLTASIYSRPFSRRIPRIGFDSGLIALAPNKSPTQHDIVIKPDAAVDFAGLFELNYTHSALEILWKFNSLDLWCGVRWTIIFWKYFVKFSAFHRYASLYPILFLLF